MLDETIEELTRILIKMDFENKEKNQTEYIKIKRTDLVRFCIKLVKLVRKVKYMEDK